MKIKKIKRTPDRPPFPAIIECAPDALENAIAWFICQQMRALVYMRAPHKAREITKDYNLVELIFEPTDHKLEINYTIEINTSAILAGIAAYLSERGSIKK